jgi:hypothetical protein
MKMNSAQIEQTLHQLNAEAIPENHPVMSQLEWLFGEHTYFLDSNGLNIVEPVETAQNAGRLVNLANWTDANAAGLQPHEPEPTELMVEFETDTRH